MFFCSIGPSQLLTPLPSSISGDYVGFKRRAFEKRDLIEDKGDARGRKKFVHSTLASLDAGKTMGGRDYELQSKPASRIVGRRLTLASGSTRHRVKTLTEQYRLRDWVKRWFPPSDLSLRIVKPKRGGEKVKYTPPPPPISPPNWGGGKREKTGGREREKKKSVK